MKYCEVGSFDWLVSDDDLPKWERFLELCHQKYGNAPVRAPMLVDIYKSVDMWLGRNQSKSQLRSLVNKLLWHSAGRVFGQCWVANLGQIEGRRTTFAVYCLEPSHPAVNAHARSSEGGSR